MADAPDFRNDPEYIKTRDEMDKTRRKSSNWTGLSLTSGIGGIALGVAALAGAGILEIGTFGLATPVAIGLGLAGVALIGTSIASGFKARKWNKDNEMAQAEAGAQRTGYYVSQALEQQHEKEIAEGGTRFQDMENARRAQGAAAVR